MKKHELITLLNDIQDDGNIDEILQETELFKNASKFDTQKILNDKNFMSFLDSEKDKHADKVLKTWKANNLEKVIESEVLKRTSTKETPEQKAIRELQEQLASLSKEKEVATRQAKFKDVMVQKNIPTSLTNFLLGEDDETTEANINIFEEAMSSYVEKQVNAKLKDSSYVPPKGDKVNIDKTKFSKMTLMEKQNLFDENPELFRELSGN